MTFLAIPLAVIFTGIAGLHAYWGLGGKRGGSAAIPQQPDGRPLFAPGPAACFAVAVGLGGFAHLCLALVDLAPLPSLPFPRHWLAFGMSAIFAARTAGDFRFFGLFRKVRTTDFARLDRLVYTPLCAGLAISLAALALLAPKP